MASSIKLDINAEELAKQVAEQLLPMIMEKLPGVLALAQLQGEQVMSTEEVRKLKRCRKDRVVQAIRSGELPATQRNCGRWDIKLKDAANWEPWL